MIQVLHLRFCISYIIICIALAWQDTKTDDCADMDNQRPTTNRSLTLVISAADQLLLKQEMEDVRSTVP
jgi:hypothetical protein